MDYFAEDCPYWRYTEQAPPNTKLNLLTVDGMQVVGVWSGKAGEFYIAWAGLIKRNKDVEAELGYTSKIREVPAAGGVATLAP